MRDKHDEQLQLLLDKYADLIVKLDTRLINDRRTALARHLLESFALEFVDILIDSDQNEVSSTSLEG